VSSHLPGHTDTIFALSSGRPPAAIAVVRLSGPRCRVALEALIGRVPKPRHATLALVRNPTTGDVIDQSLALWFPGPASETGEDVAELQLHGGHAVIAATLAALGRIPGLRMAEPGEFTRRAFEHGQLDLTSLMVLLESGTFAERLLIPPFLYFFLMLYPPNWISNARSKTAGAAGGCILIRRSALERIGGLAAIRGEIIDDCSLARAVKRSGGKIWMGLTRASRSLRAYSGFGEIRDMIARTAFTQLRHSTLQLLATLIGLALTFLIPAAFTLAPQAKIWLPALLAWCLMTASFLPTVTFYRLSPIWAPLLPTAALFYSYATLLSAIRYWLGRGGQWKGRAQASETSRI